MNRCFTLLVILVLSILGLFAQQTNTVNDHAFVDMGTEVMWATCNVGANTTKEAGNFYSWGGINTQSEYDIDNCFTYNQTVGDIFGNAQYDAARAQWGKPWRMPTMDEFSWLIGNCVLTYGEDSLLKVKRTDGNDEAIYFPLKGFESGHIFDYIGYGYYWTGTEQSTLYAHLALLAPENGNEHTMISYTSKYFGLNIRPVFDPLEMSVDNANPCYGDSVRFETAVYGLDTAGVDYEFSWNYRDNIISTGKRPWVKFYTSSSEEYEVTCTLVFDNRSFKDKVSIAPKPKYVLSITCPENVHQTANYGEAAVEVSDSEIGSPSVNPSEETTWGSESVTRTPDINQFSLGETNITWTVYAEDANGCRSSATCNQKVIVEAPSCEKAIDYEGNEYPSVFIGANCWMKRNLVSKKYSNGDTIIGTREYVSEMYPDAEANVTEFGYLYPWECVKRGGADENGQVQGVCPEGWVLPTEAQMASLNEKTAQELKSTNYWINAKGTNASGFNAKPAGYYDGATGRYVNMMGMTYFWSIQEEHSVWVPFAGCITHTCGQVVNYSVGQNAMNNAYSVRCVKGRAAAGE